MAVPTLEQVRAWIQVPATVVDDPSLQQAYDAELALQAFYCIVPEPYPPELAQALYRRVGRVVAAKPLALGVMTDEFGTSRLSQWEPETERLEGPYRTIPVA